VVAFLTEWEGPPGGRREASRGSRTGNDEVGRFREIDHQFTDTNFDIRFDTGDLREPR
jgi:hypothetical protein